MTRRSEAHWDPAGQGPDFTDPIMTRLGYRRVPRAEARRRRLRRLAGRGVVLGLLGGLLVVGLEGHARSDLARRPVELTVPAALGEEIEAHQQRLNRVIRSIRSIRSTPARTPAAAPAPVIDEDIDRSAIGPMRWI